MCILQCRNCDYKQLADNNCIYVNKITHEIEYENILNAIYTYILMENKIRSPSRLALKVIA